MKPYIRTHISAVLMSLVISSPAVGQSKTVIESFEQRLSEYLAEIVRLRGEVANLSEQNSALEERIVAVEEHGHDDYFEHTHRDLEIPTGVVIASTKICSDLPGRWKRYAKAEGRFIIGVGKGPLEVAVYLEQPGGQEKQTLKPEEMPSHWHYTGTGYQSAKLSPWGTGPELFEAGKSIGGPVQEDAELAGRTSPSPPIHAKQKPFSIMPPYVALHYCEKLPPKTGGE